MTNETMTIHKALCELKTLDSRINKKISNSIFVVTNKHSNDKIFGVPVADYCKEMESDYQSITDLMRRRAAIKAAVVKSNAETTVTINNRQYSVATAIEMKNSGIPLMQNLLRRMEHTNRIARSDADKFNGDQLEARADEYVKSLYGGSDLKSASDEIKKVRADFIAAQTLDVVDPIGVVSKMEALEKEISDFLVDVDSALSVSNALTSVEIIY